MAHDRYDVVVIGAGPGGYVAAIRAAQLGMRVACVDKEAALGGTCLRVGCIPSKALLDSSEHFQRARQGLKAHGIQVENVRLDLKALQRRKDQTVRALTQGVAALFKKHKVEAVQGAARLVAPGKVEVSHDGKRQALEADHVLIATGSAPLALEALPFDGERIVSSTEALAFERVPERLLVVGGGAIGLELGSVWARLGSEVLVVELMEQLVPGMDRQLAQALQKALERQGLRFALGTKATGAQVKKGRVEVALESAAGEARRETAERVLVAVGRRPYTEGLGLEALGVERDAQGHVVVDERFQTAVPGVYAIGDVIRGPMLAHKASEEGIACVEGLAGQAGHVNYEAIPAVVYTQPELASVGRTEAQCRQAGLEVRVGTFPFRANGRARAAGELEGLVKVVAEARTDRVLGVHLLGPHASELVAECTLALEFSASAEDIARTCHAHPTLSEALREAALDVGGRVIHR